MALTVAKVTRPGSGTDRHAIGDLYLVHGTITFDSSYPTGGEAITAADLGFAAGTIMELLTAPPTDGANFSTFDRTNGTLKLFTADGVEAVAASDQSAVVHRFIALVA